MAGVCEESTKRLLHGRSASPRTPSRMDSIRTGNSSEARTWTAILVQLQLQLDQQLKQEAHNQRSNFSLSSAR
eukprot:6190942-Pleurochrysis_carterae.AAC.1